MVDGAPVLEAAAIDIDDVDAAIGGLTPAKRHAAQLAADALHRALASAAASSGRLAPAAPGERVAVAMSGGVDSAVAALLERERGAEVVGVTVKLWADPDTDGAKACCSPEAVLGARALAHSLGIPHFTLDLEEEFRRRVVGRFIDGYAAGSTPNPCVLCNGEVRIAAMVDLAERLGADRLVTGHYARIVEDADGPLLASAADEAKDQSYMLAALPPRAARPARLPADRADQARGAGDRRPPRARGRQEAREPGPLLPRRPGQARVPAPPRRPDATARARCSTAPAATSAATPATTTSPSASAAGSASPPPSRSTSSPPTRSPTRSRSAPASELETRRVRVRDAILHRDGARVDAVRLRYHSRALPASIGGAGPGRHDALEVELGEEFVGASPGQTAVLLEGETIVGHGTIAAAA